jgi:hypothetical protein
LPKRVRVEVNKREWQKLLEQVARQLEEADQHFRQTHTGLPVDVIRADAPDALPTNIQLTAEQLNDYAAAVADDRPFEFHLRG